MTIIDTSDVDSAVIAKLSEDEELMAILPGGVGWDLAAMAGTTKFAIVSQVTHEDAYVMPNRVGWERITYLVKAVTMGSSGTEVRAAAKRIHELLQHGQLALTGYVLMDMARVERVRYTEVDEATDQRWQHRGGHYDVMVCPQ